MGVGFCSIRFSWWMTSQIGTWTERDLVANGHLATLGQKSRFGVQRQRGAIEKGDAA